MRLRCFLAVVLAVATPAYAAAPPSQPGYQVNLGIGPSSPSFAYGTVPMWIDSTNTSVSSAGLPRPTSTEYPLPMACITGCSGSGSSTPTGAAGSPNAAVVSVQGVQGGTPQPVTVSALPLPAGAATSANQPALNADGGALAHVTNFPANQAVTVANQPATAPPASAVTFVRPTNATNTAAMSTLVFGAGVVKNGCEFIPSVSGYVSLTGSASMADEPIAAGATYKCPPFPNAQGVAFYSASAGAMPGFAY